MNALTVAGKENVLKDEVSKITRARRKETQLTLYLLILALAAIVAIVAVSNTNLNGADIARSLEYQGYCSDDDPQDDFYIVGTAQMGNRLYTDSCLDKDTLVQHYCSSGRNVKTRRLYECPNGCKDGACLAG